MRSRDLQSTISVTAREVQAALWESRLLPAEQLRRLSAELADTPDDGVAWAHALVQRGLLTAFQAEQVVAGNGERLLLGGYRILERLGEGGMGQVYKAEHQFMQRVVALKVIVGDPFPSSARSNYSSGFIEFSASPSGARSDESAVQAFYREARAAGQLRHPNIIAFHDAAEDRGIHFLVMEYVSGIDLGRLVRESGPLPPALACEYIRQAAVGLHYAYEQGVIHRDIKPSNLFLTWEEDGRDRRATLVAGRGVVKLLDLGLARAGPGARVEDSASDESDGCLCGTPDFMAPEIAEDSRIADTRADLYSLGCTLYYLLTGHPPYPGGTWTEKLVRHRLDSVTPPQKYRSDLPGPVVAILYRLLAKDPAQRYPVAAEVAATLQAWLATAETTVWPEVPAIAPVAVQTPDFTCEGTWPSLDLLEIEAPAPVEARVLDSPSTEPASMPRAATIARKAFVCGVALCSSALVGLLLAWLLSKWEQDEPNQFITPVAAIPGSVPATEVAAAASPTLPFAVRGARHATLAAALDAAQDGDKVIIEGNGPYFIAPHTIRNKALTLQAAAGCRPRLRLTPAAGKRPYQALLTSNRPLTLAGLDLICPPGDGLKSPREPLHLVYCERAALRLIECHMSAPGVTAPIVCRNSPTVEMRNCKLAAAGSGLCLEIGEGPAYELALEGNQITMEQSDGAAVSLWSADGKNTAPVRLLLERNSVNAGRVVACTSVTTELEITARGNDLAFDQALASYTGLGATRVAWRGGDNIYHAGGEWLLMDGKAAGVRGLEAWRAYAGDRELGSRER